MLFSLYVISELAREPDARDGQRVVGVRRHARVVEPPELRPLEEVCVWKNGVGSCQINSKCDTSSNEFIMRLYVKHSHAMLFMFIIDFKSL